MNLIERLRYDWDRGQMTQRLIMVNVFMFLLVGILGLLKLGDFTSRWLALSPDLMKFITAPWTLITYGFLHHGFMHILFNMMWLYWIGKILEEYIGARKILPVYIFGIIAGGLLMMLFYNLVPSFNAKTATMVGASAGVMAVVWATVALLPDYKIRMLFIGTTPLIYVAAFMTAMDLLMVAGSNAGGHIAHIGGALMGYWYIKLYQRGTDLSVGFNKLMDQLATVTSPKKKKEPTFTVKRGGKSKTRTTTNMSTQAQVDAILDKINKSGYSSLSQKEKDFLKRQSQN